MTRTTSGAIDTQVVLTKRQAEVLECVAKRLTLKETATRLAVSESAINAHIKSLKTSLGVNSLSELSEIWRSHNGLELRPDYRNSACRISGLVDPTLAGPSEPQDERGQFLTFSEPVSFHQPTPWETEGLEIVPGVLRGVNGKWNRAVAILLIAIGLLALIMLGLGVGQGIDAALSGRPAAPPTRI